MDTRLDTSRSDCREDISSHSKKNKKRSSKRDSVFGLRTNNAHNNQNNDIASGMEYQHIMWQPNVQHNFPNNGQRLFATTSDPSVCGYTPMPMTYAMEPVSLPAMYRLYQPVPVPGIRTIDGRTRRHSNQKHPINLGPNVHSMVNGYTSLQENGTGSPIPLNYQNGDYTSLPPSASKSNEINGDELNSEHRRYSDPGLGPAEAPLNIQSDDSDSADSGSSIMTIGHGNKLILSLIEQMTELKKSNSQLFKELSETKSELETVKSKLTRCKHSSSTDYQPGMFSDLIREIREANKACEEVVVAKAESMLQEKFSQRSLEVEKLNNQILQLTKEKEETNKRFAKLEEDVAALKLNANNEGREIAAFEEETLALRRELQEARASRNLAENHMAKLEKLVHILRNKTIAPTDEETVYDPRRLAASALPSSLSKAENAGSFSPSSSSSSSSVEEEEGDEEELEEKEEEEEAPDGEEDCADDDVDGDQEQAFTDRVSFSSNDLKASSMIENSINLSGPVTDL